MEKIFLGFILMCIFSQNVIAQNYQVSGAGSTEVDGVYVVNGTYNGKTKYTMTNGFGTFDLQWDCNMECENWHIIKDWNAYYTTNAAASDTPPSSGWYSGWFGNSPAPSVEIEGKSISYSITSFYENEVNDGTLANGTSTITYNGYGGDFFTGSNGENFLLTSKASITNLPTGLSATLVRSSNTSLSLTITGTATAHENANSASNLTITFANTAFDQNDALGVSNYSKNDLLVKFRSELHVATSGAPYSTITAAVSASSDYDIIKIDAGTYTESNISFAKNLIFKGAGASTTIISAHASYNSAANRIFTIETYTDATVKFYDLTFKNGKRTAGNAYGGAIYTYSSTDVELYRCVLKDNICDGGNGGGICSGGAIQCGTLTMEDCLLSNNIVTRSGNSYGGAVYAEQVFANNCTFVNNSISSQSVAYASAGGAMYTGIAVHEIVNCTFTTNSCKNGGAIYFATPQLGTFLKNTIIYGNTATGSGDNIYKDWGTELVATSCIIASSTTNSGNVFTGGSTVSTSDPLLGSLADNGGESYTIAVSVGSPAINAGIEDADVYTYDQRLYTKIGTRDIGAFEYGASLATLATITTTTASSVASSTASSGGNITSDGGANVTAKGVCWSTSANPTIADSKTSDGTGTGSFTSSLTGLTAGTTYHYRAYATNSVGTSYGDDLTFTTLASLPTITTTTASAVTSATASTGGNITSDGGASVTAKGVCWSTSANPTIADSKTSDGTGTGSFTSSLTGLSAGTTYHYRAYATNSVGTSYGSDLTLYSNCSQIETFNPTYPNGGDGIQSTVPPTMNYFSVFKQVDPYVRSFYDIVNNPLSLNEDAFDNKIWFLSNEGEEYYDADNDQYTPTYLTNSVTKFTQYSKFTLKTMNVGRTQNTEDNQASLTFSGYLGSSLICSAITVDVFQAGVYGTGENTITVTRINNDLGDYSVLTFGSAWTGINMFQIEVLTDHPTYIGIDHIVHEVACSCTKPVSQNFNDAYGVTPGTPSYSHNNALLGCVNYSIAYNSMAFWNTTQPNMSGTSLAVDQISSSTATYFKMASTDNSINFKLSEFQMSKITGNSSINYNIVGYNNGSSVVTVNGINLGSSATFGSGNDAITYTKNASTEGGKLSFGSNWEEIDEVRIFSAGGEKLHFELDDIVFLYKPTVSTTTATSVTTTTASSGGNVSDEGSISVTSRGVCWSTSANPTISDSKTTDASGTGSFTSSLSGLSSGTTYHYRAYATNSAGTSYGSDLTFTTISVGPSTFQSTTTGNWSTAGSWLSNAVPSSTDNAQINNGHNVTISANTTIDDLILKSGSTVTVSGTAVLTITGNLQDEGGNFAVASGAQVVVMGNVNNSSAASKLVNTSINGLLIKGNVDVGQ